MPERVAQYLGMVEGKLRQRVWVLGRGETAPTGVESDIYMGVESNIGDA